MISAADVELLEWISLKKRLERWNYLATARRIACIGFDDTRSFRHMTAHLPRAIGPNLIDYISRQLSFSVLISCMSTGLLRPCYGVQQTLPAS